jgi:hypothetical protein
MPTKHQIENIRIEDGVLCLTVDGNSIHQDLEDLSPLLASASKEEQQEFEVSPSGYGIHWPLIDEDISVDGLWGIVHKPVTNRKVA